MLFCVVLWVQLAVLLASFDKVTGDCHRCHRCKASQHAWAPTAPPLKMNPGWPKSGPHTQACVHTLRWCSVTHVA